VTDLCDGAVTLASIWIGEAKNVEMKTISCPNLYQRHDRDVLVKRQTNATNVCGAPCKFNPIVFSLDFGT
jgi:hypothetical protein